MDKFVITIARGYGSGGRTLGKHLAEKLGINYYDREILNLTADATGINKQLFEHVDEQLKGTSLYKVASNVYRGEVIKPDSEETISNDSLFAYQAKVIRELAKYESFVVIGRCADYILKDYKNVLKLFVHAPVETCVNRMGDFSSLSREELKQLIYRTDKRRSDYYYYYTGRMWNDARNYDLCINSEELNLEKCLKLVESYLEIKFSKK